MHQSVTATAKPFSTKPPSPATLSLPQKAKDGGQISGAFLKFRLSSWWCQPWQLYKDHSDHHPCCGFHRSQNRHLSQRRYRGQFTPNNSTTDNLVSRRTLHHSTLLWKGTTRCGVLLHSTSIPHLDLHKHLGAYFSSSREFTRDRCRLKLH